MMDDEIRVVIATFKNKISWKEIPYFRGCMIQESGNNCLFHNHQEEGFRYVYPLVQYKIMDGNPVMVGLNEGAVAIEKLLEDRYIIPCQLGNRQTDLYFVGIRSQRMAVQCHPELLTYSIKGWLPLNRENYKAYLSAESLVEQVQMLERILTGNILSFAKGIGVFFEHPVSCRIRQIQQEKLVNYKHVGLMSFSGVFQSNVTLPDYIGLGKSVSIGQGIIKRMKDEE